MKQTRIFAALIAALLCVSLCACAIVPGKREDPSAAEAGTKADIGNGTENEKETAEGTTGSATEEGTQKPGSGSELVPTFDTEGQTSAVPNERESGYTKRY